MKLSVATANYYTIPFERTLDIIAGAGFASIELDLYWERKQWAMAQHLRGYAPERVVGLVRQAGLTISSIHYGGGVLEQPDSAEGLVNPQLQAFLDCMDAAPDCLVFHTPHIEGQMAPGWWQAVSDQMLQALEPYQEAGPVVTIENMPLFDGYTVPITTPEDLAAFARKAGLGVTLDTTHYAQIGVDITQAAKILDGNIRTIHLSDYRDGRAHVFVGDGTLDLPTFFKTLDLHNLQSVTLECSAVRWGEQIDAITDAALVERLKVAKARVESLLAAAA